MNIHQRLIGATVKTAFRDTDNTYNADDTGIIIAVFNNGEDLMFTVMLDNKKFSTSRAEYWMLNQPGL
jgi:hypothetical protein